MKLATFCESTGMTHQHLAELAGCDRSLISYAANGKPVSRALAPRISAATGGQVSIPELLYPDGVPEGATLVPADPPAAPPSEEAA